MRDQIRERMDMALLRFALAVIKLTQEAPDTPSLLVGFCERLDVAGSEIDHILDVIEAAKKDVMQ